MKERPPGIVLGLLLLCAAACAADDITTGTLSSLHWDSAEAPATLRVCPALGHSEHLDKSAVFVFTTKTDSGAVDEIINLPTTGCDGEGKCCSFTVDLAVIDFKNEKRYQLNMPAKFYLNDLQLEYEPEDISAAQNSDTSFYRYNGASNWVIGAACEEIDNDDVLGSACYVKKLEELCFGDDVQICNAAAKPSDATTVPVKNLVSLLNTIENTVTFEYKGQDSSSLEILLIILITEKTAAPAYAYCGNEEKCDIQPGDAPYQFSVVQKDDSENVLAWSIVSVEDWEVVLSPVSEDTLHAHWSKKGTSGFIVTLIPSDGSELTYSEVQDPPCDDTTCEVFFTWLPGVEGYTVEVSNDDRDAKMIVPQTTVKTITDKGNSVEMTHKPSDDYIETGVSFTEAATGSVFVIIDIEGKFIKDDPTASEPVTINTGEFTTTEIVRLLLYSEDVTGVTYWQADKMLFLPEFEPRSKGDVVLAKWSNANDGTVTSNGFSEEKPRTKHEVQCAHLRECEYYLKTDGAEMTEESGDVTQKVSPPNEDVSEVTELQMDDEFTQRADNRFLVCFTTPAKNVVSYELGMEKPGSLSSYASDAELQQGEDGQSCLLTKDPVAVGSYADVWAVVTGFDEDGKQILGGDQTSKFLLAAEGAYVLGVVQYTESKDSDVWVSWLLVEDTQGLTDYTVELRDQSGNGVDKDPNVKRTSTSYTFEGVNAGSYSACVSIAAADDKKISLEMCSAMIYVDPHADDDDLSPPPKLDETYHQIDPEEGSVKFSWEYKNTTSWEEVSSFIVDWSGSEQANRRKRSAEELLPGKPSEEGFMVVPGSKGTVDLHLPGGYSFDICVQSSGGKSTSDRECTEAVAVAEDMGDYDTLKPKEPTDLKYDKGTQRLTWDAPEEGCESISDGCIYSVLWKQDGTEKATQTLLRQLDMSKLPITPGSWTAEVRTLKDNIASSRQSVLVDFTGIDVKYEQSSLNEITLNWEINDGTNEVSEKTYKISVTGNEGEEPTTVTCTEDCSTVLTGIENGDKVTIETVDEPQQESWNSIVILADQMEDVDTEVSSQPITISMEDIERVTLKTKSVTSTAITSVTWNCVDGASRYKLSVTESGGVTYDILQSTPCMYSFANSSRPVEAVEVRAGYEVTGTTCTGHFGDPLIVDTGNGKNSDDGASVLVIVLSVCGSLAVGAVLVLLGFNYMRPSTKKQKPMEDGSESRYGDMAASIHTGDGSHASGFANAGFDMDPYSPNSPRGRDPEQLDPKGISRHSLGHPGPHRGPRGDFAPEDRYQPPLRTFEPKSLDRAQRDMRQPDPYGPPRRRFDPEDPYRAPRRKPDPQDPPQRSSRPQPRNVDPEFDVERPPRRRPRSSHRDVERGRSPRRHGSSRRDMDDAVSPRRRPHSSHRDMTDAVSPRRQYPPGPRDGPRDGARDRSRHGPREGQRPSRRDHSAPQTSDIPLAELPRKAYPPPPPRRSDRRNYDEFSKPYNRRSSPKPSAAPPNPNFLMRAKVHGQDEMY